MHVSAVVAGLTLCLPCTVGLTITEAKVNLRTALKAHGGSTTAPPVAVAVEELAALCPSDAPAREACLLGAWKQINSPEFEGKTVTADDTVQYTLGRCSFGIFEPKVTTGYTRPLVHEARWTSQEIERGAH